VSRPIIEAPVSDEVRAAITSGWADYKAATEAHGFSDEIDKALIDCVIAAFARQGRPFSANDIRPHVEGVRKCLISRRFIVAQNAGLLTYVGVTPSSLKSTKAARVNVYRPVRGANQEAAAA
jgi:hypothetical protein